MNNLPLFVVVGRICDCEDELRFVQADSHDEAENKFTKFIKELDEWDGESDIYIEFCVPLAEYKKHLIS